MTWWEREGDKNYCNIFLFTERAEKPGQINNWSFLSFETPTWKLMHIISGKWNIFFCKRWNNSRINGNDLKVLMLTKSSNNIKCGIIINFLMRIFQSIQNVFINHSTIFQPPYTHLKGKTEWHEKLLIYHNAKWW